MSLDLRQTLQIPRSFWERLKPADPGLMAAAVAYNVFFALVPASIAFLAAASFIGQEPAALERTERTLRIFVPGELTDFILEILAEVSVFINGQQGWVIAVSVLIALWSGSRGVVALQKALGRIERMEERRPLLRLRLIGIGLTIGAGIALILTSLSLLIGRTAVEFVAELTGIEFLDEVWTWVRIPLAAIGLWGFLYSVYRWGPPQPFPSARLAALLSSVGAGLTSLAFGAYLTRITAASTFTVLGTIAVLQLWLYVNTLVILFAGAAVGFGTGYRTAIGVPAAE